jgi:hypothetical protein
MDKIDYADLTKNILLWTLSYCEKNNFMFWVEQIGSDFNFKIGEDADYFEATNQQKSNPYLYNNISEVNQSMIYHSDFNLFHHSRKINSRIQAFDNFRKNRAKEYNEFYVDFFWKYGKETTKTLSMSYLREGLDLSYMMDYKNDDYPKGFSDSKIWPYDLGLNWRHFLDTIHNKKLVDFWEKEKKFKNFHEKLKEKGHASIHSILNTLTDRLIKTGLSSDAMFKTSYMLMDVLPTNLQKAYVEKFPLMNALIDKRHKDSLFPVLTNEIIERVYFPKIDIYEYFKSDKLRPSEYAELTSEILITLKNNYKLEEKGLISAEVIGVDNLNFFMILKEDSLVNKSSIRELVINIMTLFINNEHMFIEEKAKLLRDKCDLHLLEKISDMEVDRWILNKELTVNPVNVEKKKARKI